MSNRSQKSAIGIPSTTYTREYYTNCCQGFEEFSVSQGENLPLRLKIPLDLANIHPGDRVLDVGCGRGELLIHCARLGALAWGLDYAEEALNLAHEMLNRPENTALTPRVRLLRSSVPNLPFKESEVDLIFMLDVVEHLYPSELSQSFSEIYRVLKPGGRIIVHTMPNLWYYRWGYPIYRALQSLRSHDLPRNPRDRWAYSEVHVNEQTPVTLGTMMRNSEFSTKVWLRTTQTYAYERNHAVRAGMNFLTGVYPFRLVFCNDIFAIGTKP